MGKFYTTVILYKEIMEILKLLTILVRVEGALGDCYHATWPILERSRWYLGVPRGTSTVSLLVVQ